MTQLYDLPKEIRDNVIIDVKKLEGIDIDAIDDYFLHFYKFRRAAYQYVRKRLEIDPNISAIKLSELHKIVTARTGDAIYKHLKEHDKPYQKIAYYAEQERYYNKYQLMTDLVIWDNKHLKNTKVRKQVDDISLFLLI